MPSAPESPNRRYKRPRAWRHRPGTASTGHGAIGGCGPCNGGSSRPCKAGAWRKGKRLRSLVVHSVAARALAVKRVPANTGKQTPGVAGELWNTPAQKAAAVARSGRWRGDRPAPLKRIDIPTKNGTQRPLSIPTLGDRAQRHVKVKGDANPCDPAWEASVQDRDRQRAQQASSGVRATVLRQHDGRCLVCRQVIQCEEALERHHRDGDHQHTRLVN